MKQTLGLSALVVTGALVFAGCNPSIPTPKAEVASVVLAPSSPAPSVMVDATQQFTAVAKDKDGKTISGVSFTFASSDTTKATISETGLARGVAEGTTNITATANGKTSNTVVLTVTPKVVAPAYMGFEDSVEGWTFPNWNSNSTGSVELSTLYATQGSKSLKVNSTGGGWFLVEFNPTRDFTGKSKITFDLYAEGDQTYYKTVVKSGTANDGDWTESAPGNLTAPGANSITINLVDLKLKDPKTVNTVGIYLNKGTYYIDNVQLL